MNENHRKSTFVLFVTLIVVMLGFGMVLPLMPFYIKMLGANGKQLGLLTAIYSIMQFIFAPIWGSLSDRVGRRPILMLGILGNGIFLLLFGFASQLWMLFLSRALAGILSSATLPTTMAYISDTTAPAERGDKMGKLGAAMGLGVILGPGLGGWLAEYGLVMPFLVATGLSVLALALVIIYLPESKTRGSDQTAPGTKPENNLTQMLQVLRSPVGILFFMAFLVSFGMTNFEGIFSLYTIEKFDFTPRDIGTVLVIVGLVSALVQGLLVGPLTRKFSEVIVIKAALLCVSLGFIVILGANSMIGLLITTGLFITPVALLRATVNVLIANRTASGQGTSMGLSNAFASLGRVIGPVWAGFMFDVNINYPFISGAVILLAGFLLSMVLLRPEKQTLNPSTVEL